MALGRDSDTVDGYHYRDIIAGYSVLDYGAEGDGATDDSASIEAAITAVAEAGGGNLYFPDGNYRATRPLYVITANTRIIGDGAGRSKITWDDTADKGLTIDTNVVGSGSGVSSALTTNVAVGDTTVDVASGATFTVGAWAYLQDTDTAHHGTFVTRISAINGNTVTLEEAVPCVLLTASTATLFSYVSLPFLTGIEVKDMTFACSSGAATASKLTLLFLSRLADPVVMNCKFDGCTGPLLTTRSLKRGLIFGCDFHNGVTVAGSGVEAQTSTGLTIQNCSSLRTRFGFVVARSPRSKIIGCNSSAYSEQSGRMAKIQSSNFSTFSGNTCSDAGYTGLRVEQSAYVAISGNTFFNYSPAQNGAGAIDLAGDGTHHCAVSGNVIQGGSENQTCGITINMDTAGLDTFHSITGNVMTGCTRYTIYVQSSKNTITGNTFGGDDQFAMVYVTTSCGYNVIEGNVFKREGANTPIAIHTEDGVGFNKIGLNIYDGLLSATHATDETVSTTVWKLPTSTQTSSATIADTAEKVAWTVVVPGGTFPTTLSQKAGFRLVGLFNMAANANTKTIKTKIGDVVFTLPMVGAAGNDANVVITVEAHVSATALALIYTALVMDPLGVVNIIQVFGGSTTSDLASDINVQFTQTNGTASAGDMRFEQGKLVYEGVELRPSTLS